MYSPDGFASFACLMTGQCFFLKYQTPFVEIMRLFHGNYIAFFGIQALVWFALIGSIYFLAKQLKTKHLFLTPFLLIFAGSLFVDNYVGSLENDYVAIVLFIIALIFWLKPNTNSDKWNNFLNKYIALGLVALGSSTWVWFAYFRLPTFWHSVAEQNWWVQILAWGVLVVPYLATVWFSFSAIKNKKDENHFGLLCIVSFLFPKLWFFAIPQMLVLIDAWLSTIDFKPNYKLYVSYVVFALILGQCLRVGINTYEAWSFDTSSTNCFTVNHEYLARARGKSLNYNQAPIDVYNECLKNERALNEI